MWFHLAGTFKTQFTSTVNYSCTKMRQESYKISFISIAQLPLPNC